MSNELTAPPAGKVRWLAKYGHRHFYTWSQTWFDARAKACAFFGCDHGQVKVTMNEEGLPRECLETCNDENGVPG